MLSGERAEGIKETLAHSVGDGGVDGNSDFRLYLRASVLTGDTVRLATEYETAGGLVPVPVLTAFEGAILYSNVMGLGVEAHVSMLQAPAAVCVLFLRAELMRLAPVGELPHGC